MELCVANCIVLGESKVEEAVAGVDMGRFGGTN